MYNVPHMEGQCRETIERLAMHAKPRDQSPTNPVSCAIRWVSLDNRREYAQHRL